MSIRDEYTIGRDPSCQLLINNHFVSRKHATLSLSERGEIVITDLGSANGTAVGSPDAHVRSCPVRPMDLVFFAKDNPVPGSILIKHFEAWHRSQGRVRHSSTLGEVARFQGGPIIVGSSPNSGFVLPILGVAGRHLQLDYNHQQGWLAHALVEGAKLNDQPLEKGVVVLQSGDDLSIGAENVVVTFEGPEILLARERRGFSIACRDLTFSVKDRQTGAPLDLLADISLNVLPGELVALMGPSGSGKTTLLNILSGVNPASRGEVLYDGKAIRAGDDSLSSYVGYVPQDDLLYDQLTVTECLVHSTRYRVPDRVATNQIRQKIQTVCDSLGLEGKLQQTIIGSPTNKTLSGGQRKRVNLAMELITDPLVLFLDEPTSGLSSRDTRIVVEALRTIATEMCIAIIVTIHQPAMKVYSVFDKVAFLKQGRLAYFGATNPGSIKYFDRIGNEAVQSADDIMETLEEQDMNALADSYRQSPDHGKLVVQRSQLITDLHDDNEALPPGRKPSSWKSQLLQFSQRYGLCRTRDWQGLATQILQGPIIGFFLALTLQSVSPNTPLFLLVFVSLWFGTNNTARELVSERVLFRRERRGGARIPAMLFSKFLVNCLITLVQVMTMVALVLWWLDDLAVGYLSAVTICWMSSIVGVALGLAVSAVAKTEVSAIVLTPLVLIPFIILGGLMVRYDRASDSVKIIMNAMPSRWAYEGIVAGEWMEHDFDDLEEQIAEAMKDGKEKKIKELREKTFQPFSTEHEDYTHGQLKGRVWISLTVLMGMCLALLGMTWGWIHFRR